MTTYRSDFLNTLQERQYIHQCSDFDGLDDAAANGIIAAYIGFDCTAPSLHVGNLISIMMLRHLQQSGHKPIVLIGGGTTKVGDPSGKDEARRLLEADRIAANIEGIGKTFARFLDFGDGRTDAVMVNNADWLDALQYIDFLREYGQHFSVNRMLSFDSVKLRLDREQPLSFLEFNYMVLQAYDFVELNRKYDCILQMGGSDQWGNIVSGVDLGRRVDGSKLYGLTTPLLTTASGTKMGKTAAGAVWLNGDLLSPYDYWQFWRNTEDADIGRLLRLFTELPLDEIRKLETLEGQDLNEAKKTLATAATSLAHGQLAAERAAETARETFESGASAEGLPTVEIAGPEFENGFGVLKAIVAAGFANSNGEARRLVQGGGVRINDELLRDERADLSAGDLNADGVIKISVGKKRHALLRPR